MRNSRLAVSNTYMPDVAIFLERLKLSLTSEFVCTEISAILVEMFLMNLDNRYWLLAILLCCPMRLLQHW